MRHALAASLLVAIALPAAAQDRPPAHPTRDVSITYRFEGGPAPQGAAQPQGTMRMSWLNAEQKMRIDPPGAPGWMVTDTRAGTSFLVQDQQRMVMQMPRDPSQPSMMEPPPGMQFTRGGTETLLGQRCTVWTMKSDQGEGQACITDDGVMLRARGAAAGGAGPGAAGSLVATEVSFAPQDPARFQAPDGYRTLTMPGMPGGPGGAPRPGATR